MKLILYRKEAAKRRKAGLHGSIFSLMPSQLLPKIRFSPLLPPIEAVPPCPFFGWDKADSGTKLPLKGALMPVLL
jgi:hypothetical protein